MCGIAGLMTTNGSEPDRGVLAKLGESLIHRGPDGVRKHIVQNIGFVHTRLSIIDIENGWQPLFNSAGRSLIANGEIYNYLELRETISAPIIRSKSDCEIPLHLSCDLEEKYVDSLRGMYAIAIHDPQNKRLLLSRDPFGIKPLYYIEGKNHFAFASEPQAIISAGLARPEINRFSLQELLQLQFTTGTKTIYKGISRLLPGESVHVTDGKVIKKTKQEALPDTPIEEIDEKTALIKLDNVLERSVELHQRSDVPYGMFLSGGVDSSILLALMSRLNDQPVTAFTVGFSDSGAQDERETAKALALATGARHVEIEFGEEDFWELLPKVAGIMDDPVADYAILPTYKLGKAASDYELKVILTGEGGDEFFAGYGRYRSAIRPWWFGGPRQMRKHGHFENTNFLSMDLSEWRSGILSQEHRYQSSGFTKLQTAQAIDINSWLPNDLLLKLDRCLMAHGVEGRTPFLDREVCKFAFGLPDKLKIRGKKGKYILRRWLKEYFPLARPFSRKRGFTVPIEHWIFNRGSKLGQLVAIQPGILEIAHKKEIENLFKNGEKRFAFSAWVLLFYALWHRRHVLGIEPDGDVFETLSAPT